MDNKNLVYSLCEDFMNEKLMYHLVDILHSENKRLKNELLEDNEEYYFLIRTIIGICLGVTLVFISLTFAVFIGHKMDIEKQHEFAKICQETGYGCYSDTNNKDIKYDNTPIIKIKDNE